MKKLHILFLRAFFTLLLIGGIDGYCQTFQWAKRLGGTNIDEGNSIAVDALGNVYTTGAFEGAADFDPGPGIFNISAVGGPDIFVCKLDASGNFLWAKSFGGIDIDFVYSIAVDDSGNVYTTGEFNGTVDFDPGLGIFNLVAVVNIFISKLDSSGNFVWAKSFGGGNVDMGKGIAIDALGNVYTTGVFSYTADFDPGPGIFYLTSTGFAFEIFISKLDASGNFVWAKKMSGCGNLNSFSYSIAVDGTGNVYTTGSFVDTVDFDPGPGVYNLTSEFDSVNWYFTGASFISKLDSSGNFVWAKDFGASDNVEGHSIGIDIAGNVYTTGYFTGTADFDPGAGVFNLTGAGGWDIFVSKLNVSGDFVWAKIFGATTSWDQGFSIAVDIAGNVYTTGRFSDTADFDPGAGAYNLISSGGTDSFISKLDSSGNFMWAGNLGGTNNEIGKSIAVDPSGNIYTTGYFTGTADFDPGAGVYNLTSAGMAEAFVHIMSIPVGINENGLSESFRIYPNPASSELTIRSSSGIKSIEIYDVAGQKVTFKQFQTTSNNFSQTKIDVSTFPNGIYFVAVDNGKEKAVRKFVKE